MFGLIFCLIFNLACAELDVSSEMKTVVADIGNEFTLGCHAAVEHAGYGCSITGPDCIR